MQTNLRNHLHRDKPTLGASLNLLDHGANLLKRAGDIGCGPFLKAAQKTTQEHFRLGKLERSRTSQI